MLKSLLISAVFAACAFAQGGPAYHVGSGTSLPSKCNPQTGDVFVLYVGSSGALYNCTGVNTWTSTGNASQVNGGTIPVSAPVVSTDASGKLIANPTITDDGTTLSVTGRNLSVGTTVLSSTAGLSSPNFLGARTGLALAWVDADTISVSAGGCVTTSGTAIQYSGGNVTFAALDTGTRTVGVDYALFETATGMKLTAISTYHATGLVPLGSTAANSCLLGYFHNGKALDARIGTGDIFQYSVTSNALLDRTHPFRAVQDLPSGVPLPGMVKVGNIAIGIYEASADDATPTAAGSSSYPTSRYGVVPMVSVSGWSAMQIAAQAGARLPTWAEWLMAVEYNPGSRTSASQNGNTNSGASSDDAAQTCTADPTQPGCCLTGTGPRTSSWTGAAAGSSWYSPAGLADAVGNVWEWTAQFFGGLNTTGQGVAWGYQGDYAFNFLGSANNPDTGGYTAGLPSMLIVGGSWGSSSGAGVRAASTVYSAGNSGSSIGFRLAR